MINLTEFNVSIVIIVLTSFLILYDMFETKSAEKQDKELKKSHLFFSKIDKIKNDYEYIMPRDEFTIKNINDLPYTKKSISAALKISALKLLVNNCNNYFNKIEKSYFLLGSFQQISNKEKIDISINRELFENVNIIKESKEEREKNKNEFNEFISLFYEQYPRITKKNKYKEKRGLYLFLKRNYSNLVEMIEKEDIYLSTYSEFNS